MGSRWKFSKK